MDWAKQTDDVLSAWTDAQRKFFSGWLDTVEQNTGQTKVADSWRQAVDTWEGIVKKSLDAQLDWSHRAADSVAAVPNVPKDLVDWSKQTQELGDRWNAAQQQLWESWFGMVRKAVPVKMLGTFDEENQKLFRAWQESVEKVTEAQSRWAQSWAEQTAAQPAAEAPKKAKNKPAA